MSSFYQSSLLALLAALGIALPFSRADLAGLQVAVVQEPPFAGALGLACSPTFAAIEGNLQRACPDGFEGVVLYPGALVKGCTRQAVRGEPRGRYCATPPLTVNILTHEVWHLLNGPDPEAHDPFREREAYEAGCRAAWVPACTGWLEAHR